MGASTSSPARFVSDGGGIVVAALTLVPDSDPDANLGKANPSFSSLGVGKTGSTELAVLEGGNEIPLPVVPDSSVCVCVGGGGIAMAIDEAVDPSLSLLVGAGDCRVVETAGEWGIGVDDAVDGRGWAWDCAIACN